MDYAVKDGVTVPLGAKMPGTYESERVTYGDSNVKDELDAINSNLSKHTLGTIVDITSHNPLNPYICPSDGYIRVTSGGVGGEQYAMMDGVALAMVIGTSTEPQCRLSVFVRKGSAISTQSNSISGTGEFIPLN